MLSTGSQPWTPAIMLDDVGMIRLTATGVPRYDRDIRRGSDRCCPLSGCRYEGLQKRRPTALRLAAKARIFASCQRRGLEKQRQRKIEHLRSVSRQFATRGEFAKKSGAEYQVALRLGILGELFPPGGPIKSSNRPGDSQDRRARSEVRPTTPPTPQGVIYRDP